MSNDTSPINPSYEELEQQIAAGLRRFLHTGIALQQIRDRQLYREAGYESFGTYLEERFGFERSHAYRLDDRKERP